MRENDSPICPIPGLGFCVRERCNFWDLEKEQCSGACFGDWTPLEAGEQLAFGAPCLISWYEDPD